MSHESGERVLFSSRVIATAYGENQAVTYLTQEGVGARVTNTLEGPSLEVILKRPASLTPTSETSRLPRILQSLDKPLSRRQKEVLELICQGLTDRVIAEQLKIECHTVRQHAQRAYECLGVTTRTQAVLKAYGLGPFNGETINSPSSE